jgi:glycolate oxidase FAD binding subunit
MLPLAATRRSGVPAIAAAGRPLACLRLEGTPVSVAYRIDKLERLTTSSGDLEATRLDRQATLGLWREIRDLRLLDPALPVLWRLSCVPSEAHRALAAAEPLDAELLFDWAGGLVWVAHKRPDGDAGAASLRGALAQAGGHATLIRAPAEIRAAVPPFQPQPEPLRALSQRVKAGFDPKAVLNPGRMYAGV